MQNIQPMRLTNLIAFVSQVGKKIFVIVNFSTAFNVISTHNNVIVKVVSVNMSGDDCFVIFEFFKPFDEFHSDFICLLRRDSFADLEGLNEMIKPHAVRLVTVYLLRGEERFVCQFGNAIVSRNICELFVLIERF